MDEVSDSGQQQQQQQQQQSQNPAGIVRDEIYITEGVALRTISVSSALPERMARSEWRVEDFELHKELYRGKTSLLYMATDKKSGIQIALKLYRKRKLSTLNRYQVEREIRIHIQLDHPNIIRLYAAFEDEKNVYMVQEFAGGGDLFEDLKRNGGSFKEKHTVRDVVVPFLNALQYLHGMGIIHRDIKPENILLTSHRVIKIADFGLSICYNQERPVTRAGTLDYMAPEVLICPDKRRPEENKDKVLLAYTAQVDAWAVGILCYELMVGYPPFEQESRAATYEHIMYKDPKFPGWMSEEARKFIANALNKNASQRPTIQELGKQPLILAYAKPVDKPPEARTPQEFLVERSPASTLNTAPSSPSHSMLHMASAPCTPTASSTPAGTLPIKNAPLAHAHVGPHAAAGILEQMCAHGAGTLHTGLAPVSSKRMVTPGQGSLDSSMDMAEASCESSPGKGLVPAKLSFSGKASSTRSSGMVIDEDASYPLADFTAKDGDEAGPASPKGPGSANAALARIPSSIRPGSTSLAKSRLGVSHGGQMPPPSLTTQPASGGIMLTQGKVSPVAPIMRSSTADHASPTHDSGVEHSGGSYYKPKSGILSDDSQLPVVRSNSTSGAAMTPTKLRPPGDKLGGSFDEESDIPLPSGGSVSSANNSKYSKLFAKMWGRNPPGPNDVQTFQVEAASGSSSFTAGSTTRLASSPSAPGHTGSSPTTPGGHVGMARNSLLKAGPVHAARSLADDFLAERADSVVLTDRTGSVVGAPSMNFKKPNPAALQARAAAADSSNGAHRAGNLHEGALKSWSRPALEEASGMQRTASEALIRGAASPTTPTKPLPASSAKSFTTPSSPGLRKLANAPIVNKIQEYVMQNGHDGRAS